MNTNTNSAATNTATAAEQQKGIFAKTRDFIHEKTATDQQLMNEKPYVEQIKSSLPGSTDEAAQKFDAAVGDIKKKFTERLDEGTDRVPKHVQKAEEKQPGLVRTKLYEATKSPEVKQREEFRQKPIMEQLSAMSNGTTNENFSEILA